MRSNTQNADDSIGALDMKFDGTALDTHEMDVKQLAPALLALNDAFEIAQKNMAPDSRIRLTATATREGSFAVDLALHIASEIGNILNSNPVNAVLNASALIEVVLGGINCTKWLARKLSPVLSEPVPDEDGHNTVTATFPDGTELTLHEGSITLGEDPNFIEAVRIMTAPTLKNGVDSVSFRSEHEHVRITSEDADAIRTWEPDSKESEEDIVEMTIQALDVSFRQNGKWRVTEGVRQQFVTLEDEAFKTRVLDGDEAMRANDLYRVLMRVEKSIDEHNHLSMRYVAIVKVLQHRSVGDQPSLF